MEVEEQWSAIVQLRQVVRLPLLPCQAVRTDGMQSVAGLEDDGRLGRSRALGRGGGVRCRRSGSEAVHAGGGDYA